MRHTTHQDTLRHTETPRMKDHLSLLAASGEAGDGYTASQRLQGGRHGPLRNCAGDGWGNYHI